MTHDEAIQHALGYAAGREDASGFPTVTGQAARELPAFMAFADAYTAGWDAYNSGQSYRMVSARDAYDAWQAGGTTIFRDDQQPRPASPSAGDLAAALIRIAGGPGGAKRLIDAQAGPSQAERDAFEAEMNAADAKRRITGTRPPGQS